MKRIQIAVLGSSKAICTKKAYDFAVTVGEELAKKNCITITGGGMGVMEAALKGAKKEGGLTVGIIPWESIKKVNKYADVTIATGIGWSRDAINVNSCDGAIIIHGGAGTLNEATYGYIREKPMVAIKTSGGIAQQFAGKHLDIRKTLKIESADTPEEAVKKVLKLVDESRKKRNILTELDKDMLHLTDKKDWEKVIKQINKNKKIIF
ncbi:MAG: TIGR00725 family protein [Nanoarchaeota archaeon]|nr:TIGR00725 family protein [Nanoarchaeota archaeon]MBU1854372.1 TIGR00725 family protein [Nanoarchaeota archaeon]